MYTVYVLATDTGIISDINSSAYLPDTSGWIAIDAGDGDRYHHAQGNYMPLPLRDEQGRYRYKLVDGAVMERTPDELEADMLPSTQPTLAERNRADIDFLAMMGGVEL